MGTPRRSRSPHLTSVYLCFERSRRRRRRRKRHVIRLSTDLRCRCCPQHPPTRALLLFSPSPTPLQKCHQEQNLPFSPFIQTPPLPLLTPLEPLDPMLGNLHFYPRPSTHTLHSTPYTLHPTPYALRPTLALHPAPCALLPAPCALRFCTPHSALLRPALLHPAPCAPRPAPRARSPKS